MVSRSVNLRALLISLSAVSSFFAADCAYTQRGGFFCGSSSTYYDIVVDDSGLAALYSLSSIQVSSGFILNSVTSRYTADSVNGSAHGDFPGGGPSSIVIPDQSQDPIVAVSTCCAGGSWGNAPQRVLLWTASGKQLSAGDPNWCSSPNSREKVPTGYILGGLYTMSVTGSNYVQRMAFVYTYTGVSLPPTTVPVPPGPHHDSHLGLGLGIAAAVVGAIIVGSVTVWRCKAARAKRERWNAVQQNQLATPAPQTVVGVPAPEYAVPPWMAQRLAAQPTTPIPTMSAVVEPHPEVNWVDMEAGRAEAATGSIIKSNHDVGSMNARGPASTFRPADSDAAASTGADEPKVATTPQAPPGLVPDPENPPKGNV